MLASERILLVRHGESTWNAERRLQGQANPPLSERGRAEATALAPVLETVPPGRAVCSDLDRARETAALVGHPDAQADPRWREIDVGEWAGRVAAEIDAPSPELTNGRGGPRKAPAG